MVGEEDSTPRTPRRRTVLKGIGAATTIGGGFISTAAASPPNRVQDGQVALDIAPKAEQIDKTISVGPNKQVNVELAYAVPVKYVKFAGRTCTTTLTPRDDSEFAIGLHAPNVGNGEPDSLKSLVGVTPYLTGEHEQVPAVVWEDRPLFLQEKFGTSDNVPPSEETDITATLWHGPTCFPPRSGKNCIETPPNCPIGPITTSGGSLVKDTETITF